MGQETGGQVFTIVSNGSEPEVAIVFNGSMLAQTCPYMLVEGQFVIFW
jgi:hypothetical protein